jgi:hypothetical protein
MDGEASLPQFLGQLPLPIEGAEGTAVFSRVEPMHERRGHPLDATDIQPLQELQDVCGTPIQMRLRSPARY